MQNSQASRSYREPDVNEQSTSEQATVGDRVDGERPEGSRLEEYDGGERGRDEAATPVKIVSRHEPDPEDWEIMRRMVTLDKLLTSPGRLAVLAALWRAGDLDYVYLQKMAGSSQGNLATHCRKLEEAGLVESQKRFVHRRANTRIFITEAGREAISGYVEGLRSLMERVQGWRPAIDNYREFYTGQEESTDFDQGQTAR